METIFVNLAVVIDNIIAAVINIIVINTCFFPIRCILDIAICHTSWNRSFAFPLDGSLVKSYCKFSTSSISSPGRSVSKI